MQNLLRNRTFWLAVLALVQTLVLNYAGLDKEIWMAIDAILLVVIGSFTVEEAARNIRAGLNDAVAQLRKLNK